MYLATRNEDRAKAAIEDLKRTTGKLAVFLKLDLSSLRSVKAAAEEFLRWVYSNTQWIAFDSPFEQERTRTPYSIQQCVRLAPPHKGWIEPTSRHSGVVGGAIEQVTVDGYDMTWGTNTLGKEFLLPMR